MPEENQKEIERLKFDNNSLTKEREFWEGKCDGYVESINIYYDKCKKLEAENASLKIERDEWEDKANKYCIRGDKLQEENAGLKEANSIGGIGIKSRDEAIKDFIAKLTTSEKALEGMTRQAAYNATNMNNSAKDRNKERERAVLAEERLRVSEKARLDAEERANGYWKQIMSGDIDGKGKL